MKVFHIITHLDVGGAERVAINLAKSSRIEGHIVEVCRGKGQFSDSLLKECEENGITVHRAHVSNAKLGIVLFPFRMLSLALRWRPDVIHTHTEVPDLASFMFFKSLGWCTKAKIVRTIHNTQLWTGWKAIGSKVEKFFIDRHANVSIGNSVSETYRDNYNANPETLIFNGLEEVKQTSFNNLEEGKINILFAGRFEPYKGISTLIAIIKHFANDGRFFFHIAGSGSMKEELASQLATLDNNRIYDSIPQLASKLTSFDYMLMPSEFEGLPLTSIEASLAGCPVIANDCAGLKDSLPETWPLKVKDNNLQDFITLIEALPQMNREELGKTAHAFAYKHFSIETMQRQYEQFYTI